MIDLDKDKGQSSDPIKGIENTKPTPRDSSQSQNTSKKPGAGGGGPEININVTPDGFELEGDVGIGGSVGIATVVAEADGSVGITAKIPIPAVPGLTANGGIVINVLTGEIESVSGGASLYIFEVSVTVVGCDIITTFSVKIPNTNIGFSYDIHTELPNCKEPEEEEPPKEPKELEEAPPTPEPYDPPMPPPDVLGEEWYLVTFSSTFTRTHITYYYTVNGQQYVAKTFLSDIPDSLKTETVTSGSEVQHWIKAPLNLSQLVKIEVTKHTTGRREHSVYERIAICGSGMARVGENGEKINEQTFSYRKIVPASRAGIGDGFSTYDSFKSQLYLKAVDYNAGQFIYQRLQTFQGDVFFQVNGKPEKPPKLEPIPKPPPPPPIEKMDNCCAASTRMIRELHEFIKPQDLKNSKLPKRLIYPDGKGEEKITCLGDFIRYLILEIDAKGFQPFSLEVRDTNAAQEGNQPLSITAYSLSAALKEILQYLIDTESDGDNANNMLVRLAYECSLIHKIAAVTQQQVDNIENFLDYEVRQEQVNLPMMFNMLAGVANKKKKGIDANDEVNTEAVMSELLQQVEHPIVVTKNVSRKQLTEALLELKQTMLTGGRDF